MKCLDAVVERVNKIMNILNLNNKKELLNLAKKNPQKILDATLELFESLGPRSLGINPTPVCNRKCTFCSSKQRNEINIQDNIEIGENKIIEILSDLELMGGKGTVLVGGGEALLACNGKINKILSDYDLTYGFNTNGVNLDKLMEKKILNKTKWISFSIIAHNKELYNKVGGLKSNSNQFEILEKNLSNYINLVNDLGKDKAPYLSAKILICKENYKDIVGIYDYIKGLGFKDIALRLVNNFEIEKEYRGRKLLKQSIELNNEEKKYLYTELNKISDLSESDILNIVNYDQNEENHNFGSATLCWNTILGLIVNIDTDGEVYLCNPKLGLIDFSIGNINKYSLKEIRKSGLHKSIIRKNYRTFDICCDLSKCRHYRVNILIEKYLNNELHLEDRSFYDKFMKNFP